MTNLLTGFAILATSQVMSQFGGHRDCESLFASAPTIGSFNRPSSLSWNDLDRDGDLDLIVADTGSYSVAVLYQFDDGDFSTPTSYPFRRHVPYASHYLATRDLDADGAPELVVAHRETNVSGRITVLKNRGNGSFGQPREYEAGSGATDMDFGDLDDDGDVDIAVANYSDGNASILINMGDGSFAPLQFVEVGSTPRSLKLGDLDGDADLDLVIVGSNNDRVSVLRNLGDGSFGAPEIHPLDAGGYPESVALGDLDGNASLDIAVGNIGSRVLSILLNSGDGGFESPRHYHYLGGPPLFEFSLDIRLGDVDGDADLDLAVADGWFSIVSILKNAGDGSFGSAFGYRAGPRPNSLAVGDLEGDGDLDLAFINSSIDGTVSFLRNLGDGSLDAPPLHPVGDKPLGVVLQDFDDDDILDIAVVNSQHSTVSILHNLGDARFGSEQQFPVGYRPQSLVAGDIDRDGDSDLVIPIFNQFNLESKLSVIRNIGKGQFGPPQFYFGALGGPAAPALGDVDGDEDLDIVALNYWFDTVFVLPNVGDGSFGAPQGYTVGDGPSSVVLGDLDRDGDLDAAVANRSADTVSILRNSGSGVFESHGSYPTRSGPGFLAIGDLNQDGDLDIVACNFFSDYVSVLLNLGNGGFSSQAVSVGFRPAFVALADLNHDQASELVVTSSHSGLVRVLRNRGQGSFDVLQDFSPGGGGPYSLAMGDMNGDEQADIAISMPPVDAVGIFLNSCFQDGAPSSP